MKISDNVDELLQLIAIGNTFAFRKFYDKYLQKVFQMARLFIKSEDICEEVVSDVFMNIWINREKLKDIKKIESYLFIICRNISFNYIDKISREPEITAELPWGMETRNSNPEELLLSSELNRIIDASVDELPERCRVIFLLSRQENLKYQEIAELLSISERTVQAQIMTALKKLNISLQKYLYVFLLFCAFH